ncbi:hypothetical protein SISNIDRAFT_491026 [Sistotremastrum niveocremeum HHB9708]|uniref:Uncharacterized protein n=1 Tax=Sistotremastrum niveocremeum HHB9708 TaxID=1314777 RepID=A0A164N8K6_9AGAM|nr:hypothetical protein SISNIDRAFT_491026 [Sistotremastrum niveocremeum HHB9708]
MSNSPHLVRRGEQLVKKAEEIESIQAVATVSSDEDPLKLMMSWIEGQAYRSAANSDETAQSYLRTIHDQLQSHFVRTRSTINSTLNAHVLINTLPNETLSRIFASYVEMEDLESSRTILVPEVPSWYTLTMVCKHWRAVAFDTPRIFCALNLGWQKSLVDVALRSCGTRLPLRLFIPPMPFILAASIPDLGTSQALDEPSLTLGKDLHLVSPLVARSTSLRLSLQEILVQIYPTGLKLVAPALKNLHLELRNDLVNMSPLFQSRLRSAIRFLFREFPRALENLHFSGMDIPEDVIHCPCLSVITVGNNCLDRGTFETTLRVLSRMDSLTSLCFNSCFRKREYEYDTLTVLPNQARISLTHSRTLTFAHISVDDALRILASINLPQLERMVFHNLCILHPPILGQLTSAEVGCPEVQRIIGQGSFLQLSWHIDASGYHPRVVLWDQYRPSWTEPDTCLLSASFTLAALVNGRGEAAIYPMKYSRPLETFLETLSRFSFESVQVLEISPATLQQSIDGFPLGPPKLLFELFASLNTLHLKNTAWTLFLVILGGEEPFLCPNLTKVTFFECAGTGIGLQQFFWKRTEKGRPVQYCELRNSDIYPRDFDLTLLAGYVGELKVFE